MREIEQDFEPYVFTGWQAGWPDTFDLLINEGEPDERLVTGIPRAVFCQQFRNGHRWGQNNVDGEPRWVCYACGRFGVSVIENLHPAVVR